MKAPALGAALMALLAQACSQPDQYLQFGPKVGVTEFVGLAMGGQRVWPPEALVRRFGPAIDTIHVAPSNKRLTYYGFELTLSGDTLKNIVLTESRHVAPEGIRVGYAMSHVRRLLGPPLTASTERWTYQSEGALMAITVGEGVVLQIQWTLDP